MRRGHGMLAAVALALLPGTGLAQEPKAYKLTIGDMAVDIDPGETLDVTLPDGKQAKVKLELNEFATYSGDVFSFVHPTSIAITQTDIDKTIRQYLMASALGTVVIIQEYSSINPVSLNQLMLQEMTKEAVQAGAELSQQPATRKLADGREIAGLKATVKTRVESAEIEVFSFGTTDQGLVMVTRIDRESAPSDQSLIDKFWESLKIGL